VTLFGTPLLSSHLVFLTHKSTWHVLDAVHCPPQVVTTRSSENGDSAFIHRNLRLGDGSDVHTIINGEPVSSSIC
jgi:hypothetical protein